MIVKKMNCFTLEEFHEVCSYISGDVMEYVKSLPDTWCFYESSFEFKDTWLVTFHNAPSQATKGITLTIKAFSDKESSIQMKEFDIKR